VKQIGHINVNWRRGIRVNAMVLTVVGTFELVRELAQNETPWALVVLAVAAILSILSWRFPPSSAKTPVTDDEIGRLSAAEHKQDGGLNPPTDVRPPASAPAVTDSSERTADTK